MLKMSRTKILRRRAARETPLPAVDCSGSVSARLWIAVGNKYSIIIFLSLQPRWMVEDEFAVSSWLGGSVGAVIDLNAASSWFLIICGLMIV